LHLEPFQRVVVLAVLADEACFPRLRLVESFSEILHVELAGVKLCFEVLDVLLEEDDLLLGQGTRLFAVSILFAVLLLDLLDFVRLEFQLLAEEYLCGATLCLDILELVLKCAFILVCLRFIIFNVNFKHLVLLLKELVFIFCCNFLPIRGGSSVLY